MMQGRFRLRAQWQKVGRLRYLSHLEVLRAQERMIRRAGLPYCVTEGFSPHMKIAFGTALGCGIAGLEEYLDVWIYEYVPREEALSRMQAVCSKDLQVLNCWYVNDKEPALSVQLSVAEYSADVLLPTSLVADGNKAAQLMLQAEDALYCQGFIVVQRKGKKDKQVSLEDHLLHRLAVACVAAEGEWYRLRVTFATRFTESGALRPDLYLAAILERLPGAESEVLVAQDALQRGINPEALVAQGALQSDTILKALVAQDAAHSNKTSEALTTQNASQLNTEPMPRAEQLCRVRQLREEIDGTLISLAP